MERRHFLATGLLAGLTAPATTFAQTSVSSPKSTDRGPLKPFYLPASPEPLKLWPGNAGGQVKVGSNQTNLQFSCVESVIGPRYMGPAPHIHKDLDEIMFVQEGPVSVLVGETVYQVEAGG